MHYDKNELLRVMSTTEDSSYFGLAVSIVLRNRRRIKIYLSTYISLSTLFILQYIDMSNQRLITIEMIAWFSTYIF